MILSLVEEETEVTAYKYLLMKNRYNVLNHNIIAAKFMLLSIASLRGIVEFFLNGLRGLRVLEPAFSGPFSEKKGYAHIHHDVRYECQKNDERPVQSEKYRKDYRN